MYNIVHNEPMHVLLIQKYVLLNFIFNCSQQIAIVLHVLNVK